MLLRNTIWSFALICYFGNMANHNCVAEECSHGYFLGRIRGRGGFAIVLQATCDSYPYECIAIKYSPTYNISSELNHMEYLQQEINTVGERTDDDCTRAIRPEYCNFVQLLGTCTIDTVPAIKMEFLPSTLDQILGMGWRLNMDAPKFIVYAFHLIQAVETLQRVEFVHGDLHSANVGFTADGALKVFDFSNSYLTQNPVEKMTCVPEYAAPETLLFEEMFERRRSDTWSIGVIIYEMFSGKNFVGRWMARYESCERFSARLAWEIHSACSARAFYFASRLNSCPKDASNCAAIYLEADSKLVEKCKPNPECLANIGKKVQAQLEFDEKLESLTKDEGGRLKLARVDKGDLVDILINLLRFDYTDRMEPSVAKSHRFFRQFGLLDSE